MQEEVSWQLKVYIYLDFRKGYRYRFRSQWVVGKVMGIEEVFQGENRVQNGILGGGVKLGGCIREKVLAERLQMDYIGRQKE